MIDVSKVDWTRIYDYANRIVQMYRDNLSKEKVDASGQLSRTADFDLDFDSYHVTIYLILQSYWYYIEKGRNKSTGKWGNWRTKYADIENWLRNKIARGTFIPTGGHSIPHTEKELKSVSYLIARKITKMGFYGSDHHGKHILEKTMEEVERLGILDSIIDSIVDAYDKRIEMEFEKL